MKVIVAMDSYKGCLTALEACEAVSRGLRKAFPHCNCIEMPVSDGGDGLLDAIPCCIENTRVTGPLPHMVVDASIGFVGDTAIIESSQACGLHLLESQHRNPLLTTTIGVGEMIVHALNRGCTSLIIGLGGSATNDLGTGMMTALGMELLDSQGQPVFPCGGNLNKITHLSGRERVNDLLGNTKIVAACDVNNPLFGLTGAAAVYAPQKGATPAMVDTLECGAKSLSALISTELALQAGAGAAGGLGYALRALCNCKMSEGGNMVLDLLDFDNLCSGASLVITGEGSSDKQTLMGKITATVMERANKCGIKTALISGQVHDIEALVQAGFNSVHEVSPSSLPIEEALKKDVALINVELTATRAITQIASSMRV